MPKVRTRKWDPMRYRKSGEEMLAYLQTALEDGDPAVISAVLGDIARAKGMSHIARATGLGRESLYKALSAEGNPGLSTVLKVMNAAGLRLRAELLKAGPSAQEPPLDREYGEGLPRRGRRRTR